MFQSHLATTLYDVNFGVNRLASDLVDYFVRGKARTYPLICPIGRLNLTLSPMAPEPISPIILEGQGLKAQKCYKFIKYLYSWQCLLSSFKNNNDI